MATYSTNNRWNSSRNGGFGRNFKNFMNSGGFGRNGGFGNFNFKSGDVVNRFILINVGVFLFISLVNIFLLLFDIPVNPWMKYLQLPAWLPTLFRQPLSIITYMFMHVGLFHLLFNMLWLYWFGQLFLNFFSSKHFRGLYILGGICGGLSFILAYNILPSFAASLPNASLLGASASVLAIVVATAVREPDFQVQFMFLGSVRLKFVALFIVAFDLLFIYNNAGGHIAHLGGAAAGWWFAAGLARGVDHTSWINKVLDFFSGKVQWKFKPRKPKMKVHYGERQKDYDFNAQKKEREEELNKILDKLRKSGYSNLTAEEKKRLFDASKR